MENLPQLFNFDNNDLRVIVSESNEIYFIAQDVCQVLGISNVSQALARLDEDEKTTIILNEYGRDYEKPLINESGLYSLVLSSRKPEAKQFKKWVTSEVLPSIRKTGSYVATLHSYQIEDPIKRAEKWIEEQKEKQQLALKAENLETALDALVEWVSILKVAQHNKVTEKAFKWQDLKAKSKEMGYEVKKAQSARFGYQNLYHVNCFRVLYPNYDYNFLKN